MSPIAASARHTLLQGEKHREAIDENGLLLKKEGGKEEILAFPHLCTDSVDNLPVFDIVVVSVKGYDLEFAAKSVDSIADEHTIVLPLLNGADIYERMRPHIHKGYLLPSCVYVGTHIESPGVIFQKGGSCRISVGRDPRHPAFLPEENSFSFLQTPEFSSIFTKM